MILPMRLSTLFVAGYQLASYRVRRAVMGIGLFLVGAIIGAAGLIAVLASMFFALANFDRLVTPSLITAGIALLLAIAIGIEAQYLVRK